MSKNRLNELVIICNSTFAVLNDKLINAPNQDSIRNYSVYATSLNLLVFHAVKWTYDKKHPTEDMRKCIDHLHILANTLMELSKQYDNLKQRTDNKVQTLYDISTFLAHQTDILEKKITEDKEGGADDIAVSKIFYNTHDVKMGGCIEMGGAQSTLALKQKILKLNNLKRDLRNGRVNQEYYDNVFIPTVDKIYGSAEPAIIIDEVSKKPSVKLADMVREDKLTERMNNVVVALTKPDESPYKRLLRYYAMRLGLTEEPFVPEITTYRELFSLVRKLLGKIDKIDAKTIKKAVEKEFASPSKKLSTDDMELLMSSDFSVTARHEAKQEIRNIIEKIEDVLETNIDEIDIPHIKPCIDVNKIQSMNPKEKMEKTCELINYDLKSKTIILPHYHKLEHYYDSLINLMNELFNSILAMIAPDNKLTCIRRAVLLIVTIVRARILNEELWLNRLLEKYHIDLADNWYTTKKGLKPEVLRTLIQEFV